MFPMQMGGSSPLLVDVEEMVRKALDSTTTSGQALIPQVVDSFITELALQMSPFRQLIPRMPWYSGTYDKNRRTALPRARAIGDGTSAPETQSTIARFSEPLKILQSKGGVTGFMEFASQKLTDAEKLEVAGHTLAMTYEEAWNMLYGNRYADPYQFPGLGYWCWDGDGAASPTSYSNVILMDGASIVTAYLDQAMAKMKQRGVIPDPTNSAWIMSSNMLNKLSTEKAGLQRFNDRWDIGAGFHFRTYMDIPIIETSLIQGNQAWLGGTVTSSTTTSGGFLLDSTHYRYKVTCVTLYGESLACNSGVELDVTTGASGSNVNTITLSWTAPSGVNANQVRKYRIYRTAAAGGANAQVLYTEIPGNIYSIDSLGTQVPVEINTWVDTGVRTSVAYDTTLKKITGGIYAPGYFDAKYDEPSADEEDLYLISTALTGVEGSLTQMVVGKDMSYFPLAPIMDKRWFLMIQYSTLIAISQYQVVLARAKFS